MDIAIDERFLEDYEYVPPDVKKVVDKYIRVIVQTGWFPRHANVHKAKGVDEEIWIAYITRTKQHFRLLFYLTKDELLFHRVLTHEEMDIWMKT